jgi:thiol:disulfide interchange protein DsbG
LLFFSASSASAQELLPELPAPLQTLVNQGAQVRYLGKDAGVDGWVMIKKGKEQYFYVLPDGKSFISGVLMDEKGKVVTIEQVRRLRGDNGDELLDSLTAERPDMVAEAGKQSNQYELKTPAEQLFSDVESSNWIPFGQAGTPVMYAFIDPQCPHCKRTMLDLKKEYIDQGLAQVRVIPVGFRDQAKAQAAYLLAAPNPVDLFWEHLANPETELPAKSEINLQGIQRNLAIMTSWKMDATPLIIYRGKDGTVKIVRGRPKDIEVLVKDLGARS